MCQFLNNEIGFLAFLEEMFIFCFFSTPISLRHSQNADFGHLGSTHRTVWGMTCLLETDLSLSIRMIIMKICNTGCLQFDLCLPKKVYWCQIPSTSEYDFIGRLVPNKGNQVKVTSLRWALIQYDLYPYKKVMVRENPSLFPTFW